MLGKKTKTETETFDENELRNLRKQAAADAQISEFISEIHYMKSVGAVFDALVTRLCRLEFFENITYLSLNHETAELKVEFSHGFKRENDLQFSFNIFEIRDAEIISTVFDMESKIVSDGISKGNDLSLRLDINNYVTIPLLYKEVKQNESEEEKISSVSKANMEASVDESEEEFEREKNKLKDHFFPVSGVFVFGCENISNADGTDISTAKKLIRLAGMSMNNILVLEKLREINEKNEAELKRARTVQGKLLPEKLPCNYTLRSFAYYNPVEAVGGDYYDLFLLKEGVYAVFIADVSGHGISAALVMSAAKVLLKTIAGPDLGPAQTLKKINDALLTHINADRYLTAFYAIIDTNHCKINYTCAGHCPSLLFNKNTKEYVQFQSDGFFIGMFPELDLPNREYRYKKDENRLVLYTDGVVDCQNREGVKFELVRLKTTIARTLEMSAEDVIDTITKELKVFTGNGDIKDDQTILIVDF